MKAAPLLALCLAISAGTHAEAEDAPAAKLIALDRPLAAGVPQCVHRFAEDSAIVAATFLVDAGRAPQLAADVFLEGDELGAPLSKGVPFQAAGKPSHPALLEGTFRLPLPDVEKPVLLRVRIRTTADGAAACAQFRLHVTPKLALKHALARMTDTERNGPELRIAIFGALTGLRELLQEWKIPFDDEGMETPARLGAHSLAIGEAKNLAQLPQMGAAATLLVIHDDPSAQPGLAQKTTLESTVAKLNTPHHDDWRTSPSLHQQLTSTIEHHLTRHE